MPIVENLWLKLVALFFRWACGDSLVLYFYVSIQESFNA